MNRQKLSRRDFLKLSATAGMALGAASLLNACGAGGASAPEASPTLRMWGNHPEWKDPLLANLAVFEKQGGVKIELEPKPGPEYVQLLNAAFQAGEGPDLPGIVPGPLLDEFLKNNYIMDLTGKVKIDNLVGHAQERVQRAGGLAGVPFAKFTVGLFYHTDIFDELGLSAPRTWDELKSVSDELLAAGHTPLLMPAKDGVIPSFYYLLASGSVIGPQGIQELLDGKRKLTDPDIVASLDYLVSLSDYFPEGYASIGYADGKASFARGDIAIALGGSADYSGYLQVNKDVKLDFAAFPPPSASEGFPVTVSGLELIYGVNPQSEHTDKAIEFINWLTTPEASQLFANNVALPVVQGVIPDQPIWAKQVEEAKYDMPFMREIIETAPVWNVLTSNMQAVLLGEMSTAELSQQAQDALILT